MSCSTSIQEFDEVLKYFVSIRGGYVGVDGETGDESECGKREE